MEILSVSFAERSEIAAFPEDMRSINVI